MDIVFNELSVSHIADTTEESGEWMSAFFNTANTLASRLHKDVYIRTTLQLREVLIGPNYTFGLWLHTLKDRDFLRKIVNQLTHKPLVSRYPYYYYNDEECHGLGIAHIEHIYAISYPVNKWQRAIELRKEFFDEMGNVKNLIMQVLNLSSEEDVNYHHPYRIFEHHKKHDNRRPKLNDGESTLNYNIPEEQNIVQELLDCSHGTGKRFNWDEDKDAYIEFQCHIDNKWHGYHIINANRVPPAIRQKIEEFRNI